MTGGTISRWKNFMWQLSTSLVAGDVHQHLLIQTARKGNKSWQDSSNELFFIISAKITSTFSTLFPKTIFLNRYVLSLFLLFDSPRSLSTCHMIKNTLAQSPTVIPNGQHMQQYSQLMNNLEVETYLHNVLEQIKSRGQSSGSLLRAKVHRGL